MKALIRALPLATALAFTVAAPVFATPPTFTHSTSTSCWTDALGTEYCSESETDIRMIEGNSGTTTVMTDITFLSTVVDATGALISSFYSISHDHSTVVVEGGGPIYWDQNLRRADEITEGGVTYCIRYRLVVQNEIERVNNQTTTEGPC